MIEGTLSYKIASFKGKLTNIVSYMIQYLQTLKTYMRSYLKYFLVTLFEPIERMMQSAGGRQVSFAPFAVYIITSFLKKNSQLYGFK